ncbi:HET-domain-containing protein [Hyaloscypha variabilis F]|uniref:HET-domain-containing protein n=1 Tax=Hyaloscypha variabilis (strain UAMH 11265 / GT02V1 / F) TaxID=1149755 RepID=A0A2J6QTS9_HYAVF|nr:HET-domain-containing protein [Hyaloscypha variabilis F]
MSIVFAPIKCRYLALSYVWGTRKTGRLVLTSHNEEALMKPAALTENRASIPNTIWDAITVVRKLGENYLWVDSLCLVQDDPIEIEQCVAIMDLFYEMATLTIVAADGDDAWAGLGGVEPTPRQTNRLVREIVPGLHMTTTTDMGALLSRSTYGARGWTMQEQVISRRLLVFVGGQIYFKCDTSHFREDLNWAGKPLHDSHLPIADMISMIFTTPDRGFNDFTDILLYYMLRKLSFQNDILRAAQGMLRKISLHTGMHFFEGLPPPLEQEYRSKGRRVGFPSYSWTGWLTPVQYNNFVCAWDEVSSDRDFEENPEPNSDVRGWIIWHCKLEDGDVVRISNTGRFRKSLMLQPEDTLRNARTKYQEFPVATSGVGFSKVPPTSYPLLLFWTICIELRLERALPAPGDPLGLAYYSAMDKFGESCGRFTMDPTTPENGDGEFALLAATNDSLWALMLVWKDGIAERRGAVELSNSVLDGCLPPGPMWKAIVLG